MTDNAIPDEKLIDDLIAEANFLRGVVFSVGDAACTAIILRQAADRLSALQAPAVGDELREVLTFLLGEGPLMHREFGDEPPTMNGRKQPYWWRAKLRAALALSPAPNPEPPQ